jgi:hypothetical protein
MAKPLWTIEELSLSVPVATIYKWRSTEAAQDRPLSEMDAR